MDLGPHATYIIISYLGVAVLTIGLVINAFMSAKRQQKRLDALEARGIRRRSDNEAK